MDAHGNEVGKARNLRARVGLGQRAVMVGDVFRRQEAKAPAILEEDAPADIAVADVEADAIAGERAEIGPAGRATPLVDGHVDGAPLRLVLEIVGRAGYPGEGFHIAILPVGRIATASRNS